MLTCTKNLDCKNAVVWLPSANARARSGLRWSRYAVLESSRALTTLERCGRRAKISPTAQTLGCAGWSDLPVTPVPDAANAAEAVAATLSSICGCVLSLPALRASKTLVSASALLDSLQMLPVESSSRRSMPIRTSEEDEGT